MVSGQWWHFIKRSLIKGGLQEDVASIFNAFLLLALTFLVVAVLDYVLWKLIRYFATRLAKRTRTNFDNYAITNRLPRYLAHILPLLLAFELVPLVFSDFGYAAFIALKALQVLGIFLMLSIAQRFFRTVNDYLKSKPKFRDKPIDSYVQVFMIFAWAAGFTAILAIITGTDIWKFLTGLGALSAVLLLIFKDTILGFVASIQVSINDMVRIGDWITFEKYGADGDVIEINLATVKVQNFDKTITTIPTYALISDSFKNWRGMQSSGGRRIKRAVIIKQQSIHFLTDAEVEALKKVSLISDYLTDRQAKIKAANAEKGVDKSLLINGRNLTNLGVFRKYIESYLPEFD
jgi:miniconductance mechanosensitive channel